MCSIWGVIKVTTNNTLLNFVIEAAVVELIQRKEASENCNGEERYKTHSA